jgi:hypothetical protein
MHSVFLVKSGVTPWLTIRDKIKSSQIATDMDDDVASYMDNDVASYMDDDMASCVDDDVASCVDDDVASDVDDDVASYVDDDMAINIPNFNHFSSPIHSTVSNRGDKFIATVTSQF